MSFASILRNSQSVQHVIQREHVEKAKKNQVKREKWILNVEFNDQIL